MHACMYQGRSWSRSWAAVSASPTLRPGHSLLVVIRTKRPHRASAERHPTRPGLKRSRVCTTQVRGDKWWKFPNCESEMVFERTAGPSLKY